MTSWTREMPTTPGLYWFYGRRFVGGRSEDEKDDYYLLRLGPNPATALLDGHLLFEFSPLEGWFCPATLPPPP